MTKIQPLQCSQGGIPYNQVHLDAKDAEIERLRAALKAVMPIAEAFRGRIDTEPALEIGRAALSEAEFRFEKYGAQQGKSTT